MAGSMQAEHRLPPRMLILAVKLRLVIRHVVLAVVVEIRVVELREVRVDRRLAVADALLPRFFLLARYFRGVVFRGFTADAHSLASRRNRSEEHTSELQSLMRNSSAVFCLTKKKKTAYKSNTTYVT